MLCCLYIRPLFETFLLLYGVELYDMDPTQHTHDHSNNNKKAPHPHKAEFSFSKQPAESRITQDCYC